MRRFEQALVLLNGLVAIMGGVDDWRERGIDWLRLTSIFFVVALHNLGRGGMMSLDFADSKDVFFALFENVAIIGVNLFGLTSGYLMHSHVVRYSKGVQLWKSAAFWSFVTTVVVAALTGSLTVGLAIRSVFPILTGSYWYLNACLLMLLILPVVNAGLGAMSDADLRKVSFCLVGFACLSWFASVKTGTGLNSGYSAIWLLALYVMGACLARNKKESSAFPTWALIAIAVACPICSLSCEMTLPAEVSKRFLHYNCPIVIIQSLSVFLLFTRIKCKATGHFGSILTLASASSFGVYLIDQSEFFYDVFLLDRFIWVRSLPFFKGVVISFAISVSMFLFFLAVVMTVKGAVSVMQKRRCASSGQSRRG